MSTKLNLDKQVIDYINRFADEPEFIKYIMQYDKLRKLPFVINSFPLKKKAIINSFLNNSKPMNNSSLDKKPMTDFVEIIYCNKLFCMYCFTEFVDIMNKYGCKINKNDATRIFINNLDFSFVKRRKGKVFFDLTKAEDFINKHYITNI